MHFNLLSEATFYATRLSVRDRLDREDNFNLLSEATFYATDIHLRDFLSLDHRKLLYTYDFGENWDHIIQLEEIKTPDPNLKYPICIKEKGVIPTDY